MPNHVTNIIRFEGDEKKIKALRAKIKGKKFGEGSPNLIDFSNIIPFPKELQGTRSPAKIVSQKEYDAWMDDFNMGRLNDFEIDSKPITKKMRDEFIKKFGTDNWYEWRNENWGTKWDAYSQELTGDGGISFQTAWSTPMPIFEKLSEMFPDVKIILEYADEDFGYNCGVVEFENGEGTKIEGDGYGGANYELANRILNGVNGAVALNYFSCQDEDCLDNDFSTFILKIMFEDFVEPDFSELKSLSEAHLEAILNRVKKLEREDLKDYENKLHEALDNKITNFIFPEGEITQ